MKKRKARGVFRHTLSSLKKVARLPSKDRSEVLKILKKTERWRKDVSGSYKSKEGSMQVAEDDVREVGKAIGVTFNGDNENMFNDLVRAGLGGMEKRQEVRKLVGNQNPSLRCIQETKLQSCDSVVCSPLWGNSPHIFSYRPSLGASGGLLTLWDSSEVDVWASESHEFVLWCHGRFIKSGEEFSVANVYAPYDPGAKQQPWDSLSVRIQALGRSRVCVCGDFNAVRSIDERRSVRGRAQSFDNLSFNRFIDDNNLIDLPLSGRKFMWFKGGGLSMSRLDRFLLSGEWCLTWPNCTQVARMRGLSDHCPLVLAANEEEWGPRPSRMLKCWKDVPGYNIFVKDKWQSYQVDGWGGFVLKEKFKMIKTTLKDWHKTHTQNLPSRIESLQDRPAALESRSRWLKEGDANSKYFHSVLANHRRGNAISSLQVGDVTVEGVTPIRQEVFSHFASHFKAVNVEKSGVDSLTFKRLLPTEVLANQLRLVMGSVISESQTAFIRDRQILDGILIANEVVDEARRTKKELMFFKRKWIKECVGTATASVLVNGSPTDEFPLERGLRQGDPLSPFLFLLVAEGLHVLMEAMEAHNLFTGYRVGTSAPISLSHLQFADDTLLMGTKSWVNVRALWAVLVLFETMSGLKVNFNKSMLVGVNIPHSWLVGDSHCVSECGAVETAQHVFISCSMFGSLWSLISTWIGSASVTALTLSDHFVQFTISAGGTRARRSFMQFIWLACVWVVWTEQNHRLFRGTTNSSLHMLDKIKIFSFMRLTAKSFTLALNRHSWWSSPMTCLGLG
ncbi:hypothetical protein TSUD_388170 [Trifolium subterraneum]|uniref:Uncharacterized protein n=1 Tax=Trifolium subterraneum TaxID=3900 RepID=A0A2Z6NF30_TRISU|nr:hypothetical protein TSUD_388170 [Trifolium subterraneum]